MLEQKRIEEQQRRAMERDIQAAKSLDRISSALEKA